MVKISVIMPVFNDEKYLNTSIKSLLNQTLKDIELICINDGSTDNSENILNTYSEKYSFIKIFNQKNQGSGKARNLGISKAKGEYIAFLDSDDIFINPEALELMYNIAKKNKSEMVSANLKGITIKNELVNNDDGVERFKSSKELYSYQYGIPYAFYKNIYNRNFLNENHIIFPDLKRGQDPVFLSKVLVNMKTFYTINVDLYGFRYAPKGGLSKINTFEKKWDYIKHFRDTFDILKQAEYLEIYESYKEKLFLFINHSTNSNDEILYAIVHEIFRNDKEILESCEKYFKINDKDLDFNTFKTLSSKYEEIYDNLLNEFRIIQKERNELLNEIHRLNEELQLIKEDYKILQVNNESIANYKIFLEQYKTQLQLSLDKCDLLLKENEYLYENLSLKDNLEEEYINLIEKYNQLEIKLNELINELNNIQSEYEKLALSKRYLLSSNDFYKNNYTLYKSLTEELSYENNSNSEIINRLMKEKYYDTLKIQENNNSQINSLREQYEKKICDVKIDSLKHINMAYIQMSFPTLSETFILNELKWLKEKGINVKVFCFNNPVKFTELDFDLEVIRFDYSGDLFNNLCKLIIEHDINLIHTHFVYPTATNFTFPIAEKFKIPFTVFAHAYDIFIKENDVKNNVAEIVKSPYCKGIFTLSEYHKNYLISRDVPEEKIILTKQATQYEVSEIYPKEFNKTKRIVSISRLIEKKGLDDLLEVANLLKNEDYVFEIYGFGPLDKCLKEKIKTMKLNNVTLKGSLNGAEEVYKVLYESDLLISPCKIAENGDRDGFPTIIFESMACGTPILTTKVAAIPEIINDGENGFLVSPNNPKELADKIKYIFDLSSEEIYNIRLKAQNDVRNVSSVDKTMNNVISTWLK